MIGGGDGARVPRSGHTINMRKVAAPEASGNWPPITTSGRRLRRRRGGGLVTRRIDSLLLPGSGITGKREHTGKTVTTERTAGTAAAAMTPDIATEKTVDTAQEKREATVRLELKRRGTEAIETVFPEMTKVIDTKISTVITQSKKNGTEATETAVMVTEVSLGRIPSRKSPQRLEAEKVT